ncbi:uncharacterized protein K460DRAFT_292463 [Cucurbitaria berberidis CBS 394.84]|uniref:VWFA domain-containing protein n=1 Tax=Cucurbitaria berberidis CBS 394.84 TaxID=1168544 RepID=A0A9P4L4C3_9PLEO|nr:uncharacterized protein K460DRAFT_292463 [Cucurbitaria berberidis CBS 394.84]KAF1841325.1 hypothetical protein K460DRAFT_292463 [Cucurbitaria berberidis CBS 394.84]
MATNSSSKATPTIEPPTAIVGCLLDVSGSMRKVLETGTGDGRATERLRAVLRAALKLARAEQRHNPNALMFVGAFGMKNKQAPVVDLCGIVEALLQGTNGPGDVRTGHEHLVALANERNVPHITKYIQEKLTEEQARIVHAHLRRNPDMVQEFVDSIPPPDKLRNMEIAGAGAKMYGPLLGASVGSVFGPVGTIAGAVVGGVVGLIGVDTAKDHAVEDSEALKLARRICDEWLLDFKDLTARSVADVVLLLERVQDHSSLERNARGRTLLDELKPHLYGWTPMKLAMTKALNLFREHRALEARVLVTISDGESTDGDPLPIVKELKQEKVTIASIFLTADTSIPRRQLHDHSRGSRYVGEHTLFNMASKTAVTQHPIPVLSSMGWEIPSSGECALYTAVCSSDALEEFCSVLLSARFRETDALLDILGRMDLDSYINDEHMRTRNNPSDQGQTSTCYAHAIAAVLHMAMLRIFERDGGCPSIAKIRSQILKELPPGPDGRNVEEVLEKAAGWYRPLRFRRVDQDGARQAVLHRRPVLATYRLSISGWEAFSEHFQTPSTRTSILSETRMAQHRFLTDGGGHAVVLVKCDPRSLTFLNSWGSQWGNNGSFSIENATVLEPSGAPEWACMHFYDIYWLESDLTVKEREAYNAHADERVRARATKHPEIFELEIQCPLCKRNAPIADFTGSVRSAVCPLCNRGFRPAPGHLVQALYARAGLSDVV